MKFALLLLAFLGSIDVQESQVYKAKSAQVEEAQDSVLVLMTEPQPPEPALRVNVSSDYKSVVVRAVHAGSLRPVAVNKLQDGSFLVTGQPGNYLITAIEFDPERGINFIDTEAVLGGATPPPVVDPELPPPPVAGELYEVTKLAAATVNDPETAKRLAVAYRSIASKADNLAAAKEAAIAARRSVLVSRANKKSNWSLFLTTIDDYVDDTTYAAYIQSLNEIARALDDV